MMKKCFEIILYCNNQQKSCEFYSILLGLEPSLNVPGMTEFSIADNIKLGLMPENGIAKILGNITPHPSTGNGIPRCELYISDDDIDFAFSRALKAGARIISKPEPRDWGDTVAYFADPDGNIIALSCKTKLNK